MYELTLSPAEIQEITKYERYTKQQHQLRLHGIPFVIGPKNEPIVLRRDIPHGLTTMPKAPELVSAEPDFEALNNGKTKKNKKDNALPPRVRSNGYSYVWKPEGSTRTIGLGRVRETSVAKVWQNYELEKAKLHNIMTVAKLWHMFMDSPAFTELAPRTQKDYRQHQRALLAVFGKVLADNVKIEQVRIFMDKRGLESKTQANHELASLSRVYGWG
ncbi:DUF4224 domain-containing protein, partial [Escherichia coli]|uniref:DUF4224 domain-containing protein n=2 Tax=Escherichia coli TaxID=562 RepID=UPI001FCDF659